MTGARAVVVAADMVTPYGTGAEALWSGLLSRTTAISNTSRFSTRAFPSSVAGTVAGLSYHQGESLVMQMFRRLFAIAPGVVPRDARLVLATTKGEIDLLEQAVLAGTGDPAACGLGHLAARVASLAGVTGPLLTVSAACASASAAAARAAAMVRSGRSDCVLVAACDAVTEFVYAGFSSLMALDPEGARPFDRSRKGLTVGESAAYAVIMSGERAKREGRSVLGEITGWGLSDDANHMTGPSRTSDGLAIAIRKALRSASMQEAEIGCISAHGTGTVYNDAMEMGAFRSVFGKQAVPVYSLKGGIGHTMGAAGLVEIITALRSLRQRTVPPTVNLRDPDGDAAGWVSAASRESGGGQAALVTNAGFSGINTAVVVRLGA